MSLTAPNDERLIRCHEVCKRTGLGRTTIWRMVKAHQFPSPIQLAAKRIAWKASEVQEWIASRPRAIYDKAAQK